MSPTKKRKSQSVIKDIDLGEGVTATWSPVFNELTIRTFNVPGIDDQEITLDADQTEHLYKFIQYSVEW